MAEVAPYSQQSAPAAYDYVSRFEEGVEIRDFANAQIASSVAKALADANLGPNDHGAVVAFADQNAVKLGVMGRLGEHLSYMGVLSHQWSGKLSGEAAVVYKF